MLVISYKYNWFLLIIYKYSYNIKLNYTIILSLIFVLVVLYNLFLASNKQVWKLKLQSSQALLYKPPCHLYLFPKVKSALKLTHFQSVEEVKTKTADLLKNVRHLVTCRTDFSSGQLVCSIVQNTSIRSCIETNCKESVEGEVTTKWMLCIPPLTLHPLHSKLHLYVHQ